MNNWRKHCKNNNVNASDVIVVIVGACCCSASEALSSSNFDRQATNSTVNVSVVYKLLSLRRFVATRTLTMATSGGRTLSGVAFPSPHPIALSKNGHRSYHVASCLHVWWVQMDRRTMNCIGNNRESASSIEHSQEMRRATHIIPGMLGTSYMNYSAHRVRSRCRISLLFHPNGR